MECLVATHLSWWLERHHLLRENQCGFHAHKRTFDILFQMEYHICDTYCQCQVMMAVFLDQEGAFDITPHEDILYKLARMGIQGPTLIWIQDFLQGCSFHSHSQRCPTGTPLTF